MRRFTIQLAALAALLLVPAAAQGKTIHFEGKAIGAKPDQNMRIAFDVESAKGRPASIGNVTVTDLDYSCVFGGDTERDTRFFDSGSFSKHGKLEIVEKDLPPAYFNDLYGKFSYPKKGSRSKPTIKGWVSSEFGYGETRESYNCLGVEEFKATPAR